MKKITITSRLLSASSDQHQKEMLRILSDELSSNVISPWADWLHGVPIQFAHEFDAYNPQKADVYLEPDINSVLASVLYNTYTPRGYVREYLRNPRDKLRALTSTKEGVKHLRDVFACLLFVPTDFPVKSTAPDPLLDLASQIDLLTPMNTRKHANLFSHNIHASGILVWNTHARIAHQHARRTDPACADYHPRHVVPKVLWDYASDWTPVDLTRRMARMMLSRERSDTVLRGQGVAVCVSNWLPNTKLRGAILPDAKPNQRLGYYDVALHSALTSAYQWLNVRNEMVWETKVEFSTTDHRPTQRHTFLYTRSTNVDSHHDLVTEWQLAALARAIWDFDKDLFSEYKSKWHYRLLLGEPLEVVTLTKQ